MGKKGFDLAALARASMGDAAAVSELDTGVPQITLIPYGEIVPDPQNGYSMDGIEELAGNIETVGLLDPLVVLPRTDAGYPLVSGHRRHAAIGRIIEGGSELFAAGVPSIVRAQRTAPGTNPRVTELFDRLTLLLANADNRKRTSADENHEAERLEEIVAELADLGYEFPGRRRDWVSELSGMSKSKLARLKVIREKLEPSIRKAYYDKGKLKEDAAYKLAQLPEEHQRRVVDWFRARDRDPQYWYAHTVVEYGEDLARLETYQCPDKLGGGECTNRKAMQDRIWAQGYHGYCTCAYNHDCCAKCPDLVNCKSVCEKMQPKAEKLRKQNRAAKKQQKEAEKAADALKAEMVKNLWLRFGNALGRANMEDADLRKKVDGIRLWGVSEEDITLLEAGEMSKVKSSMSLPFANSVHLDEAERLVQIADALGCSLDYLFCRTDAPEINTKPRDNQLAERLPELEGFGEGMSDEDRRACAELYLAQAACLLSTTVDELLLPEGSNSDTAPAGLDWHDTQIEGPPPEDAQNVVCWGAFGHELYKPLPSMLKQEFELNGNTTCRYWTTVEGPKRRNDEND